MPMNNKQPVVIDQDGKRGLVLAYDADAATYRIDCGGVEYLVPEDELSSLDENTFSLPVTFRSLEAASGPVVIPVAEETIDLKKQTREKSRVLVHKTVNEREVVIDEALKEGRVEVERIEINQEIYEPAQVRVEGATTIIPVMKEVLKVQRQLVLVEEVRLTTKEVEVRHQQDVILRSEEVEIERIDGDDKRVAD